MVLPTLPLEVLPDSSGITIGGQPDRTSGVTDRLSRMASEAEEAGAEAVWLCDHLFWHLPLLEPLTSLSVVAASTRTAAIGTCVLQLPLRSPPAVARQAATLQLLSGGRLILGLGVGSHPGEYEAAGAEYKRRGAVLDDGISTMRRSWSWGAQAGNRYRLEPEVPQIPIWLPGKTGAALRRVAVLGDGWVPLFVPASEYGAGWSRLRLLSEQAGRQPDAIEPAAVALLCPGSDSKAARAQGLVWLSELYKLPAKAFERHLVAGTAERCAEGVAEYHAAGARHVAVLIASPGANERFAAVMDALHSGSRPSYAVTTSKLSEPIGAP
ncbi:MAG: LLM class flavin-dependent oxidoreductase [Acidimicrobiales bacterium]